MTDDQQEETGWRQCDVEKPHAYTPVIVALQDGTQQLGFWSGNAWIAAGAEAKPHWWHPRP